MGDSRFYGLLTLLGSNSLASQEDQGKADDGIELGEHDQHQGVTEYFVTLSYCGDTIGANLTLTNTREKASQAAGDA